MLALFRRSQQACRGTEPDFERLLANAAELRERVSERLALLASEDRLTVLSTVHDISQQMQRRHSIPLETLAFGSINELSFEQATALADEIDSMFNDAEQNGDELSSLAAAYCQSMALLSLADPLVASLEQKAKCIQLKHEFGRQTGNLMDSLEWA